MANLVELKDLNITYETKEKRVDVVENFNYAFKENSISVIFGRSGLGKSSILNVIAGLVKPKAGDVLFQGQSILKYNGEKIIKFRCDNLGYVFQNFNLLKEFNVLDNVVLPLIIKGEDKNSAYRKGEEVLKKVGLEKRLDHYVNELSGGEQQRVAIARAIINKPRLILADEPTGNLDVKSSKNIYEIIKDLNKEGITFIIATHDENFKAISDDVLELENILI